MTPPSVYTDAPLEVVAISNATTVESGAAAVLVCVGFAGSSEASISWHHDGQTLMNGSYSTIYEELLDQGGRSFKISYLQLCNAQTSQTGNYTCSVSNGVENETSEVFLSVTGEHFVVQVNVMAANWPTLLYQNEFDNTFKPEFITLNC